MQPPHFRTLLLAASALLDVGAYGVEPRLLAQPERIDLRGGEREHGLVVTLVDGDGRRSDVTRQARYTSSAPEVVAMGDRGQCRAAADGEAAVEVSHAGLTVRVPVVADTGVAAVPSFRQDILPMITKSGCNAGGCHGKLAGQNGFRLSLRGYAPEWDHDWLTREVQGRRINAAFPAQSLLVQKATALLPHEGGARFREGSRPYDALVKWIAARAPGPLPDEADAARLEVLPGDREMRPGEAQQLLVRAHYADGRVRDVTWLAQFFSNDEATLAVKPDGRVKALRCGEASVRVHFQTAVQVVRFTMPFERAMDAAAYAARRNAIDAPVFDKLAALRLPPSPDCDDQTFIRRAFLDATGTLPTAEEVATFLADTRPDRRALLVDAILARPEWVDYWTLQLADLLQNRKERDHDVRGAKGVRAFHAWLRTQVAAGRGWDGIARDVLLAKGDTVANPAVGYYVTLIGEKRNVEESELPDSVAQSFLGTRIGCARCHNHPLERYTQDDFYHFAAFFSNVGLDRVAPDRGATALVSGSRDAAEKRKRLAEDETKLAETEKGGDAKAIEERRRKVDETRKELAAAMARAPSVNQPRTNLRMEPQTLDRTPYAHDPQRDPREQFVDWMLKSGQFSGAMVNRLWRHFFGAGLVEPVDDLRASNPPSNGELWTVLNGEFAGHGYDLRHVMRLILNSRTYQLSSSTVAGNETDTRFHSHYYARRLPAEVLLDAIAGATLAPNKFDGYPLGLRAVQLSEPAVGSYFLSLFGRSDRVTACACERKGEVTLPQLLHLKNSEDLQRQIAAPEGRLAALLKAPDDRAAIDALFLATVCRRPTETETAAATKALTPGPRDAALRDLFWALLNSKEFAFNH